MADEPASIAALRKCKHPVSPEVIAHLEKLLALAKEGEVESLFYATVTKDKRYSWAYCHATLELTGCVSAGLHDLCENHINDINDPIPDIRKE